MMVEIVLHCNRPCYSVLLKQVHTPGFLNCFRADVCMCVHLGVCVSAPRLLIASGVMWCDIAQYDWVGTNSGMDYWNGTLDWTTGLTYFSFLDRFMCLFLEEA